MLPIDVTTAEHYKWGDVCDGWHLLKTPGLSVIQERVPPSAAEVQHFHETAQQFFYILSGTASLDLEGRTVSLQAGQGVGVPPGCRHRFVNPSDADVVFLVISSPTTAEDRIDLPAAT